MGEGRSPKRPYLYGGLRGQASFADQSRGRLYPEPESATRTPFQRDRDRIIHSSAFRRLKHKTQVFVYHEGDYYRTRLTHSLEVAQIARSMCRYMGFDEDLSEAIALAHDLGHTPFGHVGEHALLECMRPFEGFDHNAHSLRLVTEIERHYASFNGLNLTWEALEGIVKHNGPLKSTDDGLPIPFAIRAYSEKHDLELGSHASLEAQIAALSDDIAYNNHDIDDGLRAGLFTTGELREVDYVNAVFEEVLGLHPGLSGSRLKHEVIRRLIALMVEDAIATTEGNLVRTGVKSVEEVRMCGETLCAFSNDMAVKDRALKDFLWDHMYRHADVLETREHAEKVVRDLFGVFQNDPHLMPEEWHGFGDLSDEMQRARVVSDYIAGMTDRFALNLHEQHFT